MEKFVDKKYPESIKKRITIVSVDDAVFHPDGNYSIPSWENWIKEFFNQSKADKNNTYNWYTGDEAYIEDMKKARPNDNFILLDRSKINISGTMIRKNLALYKKYVPQVYLDYLQEKGIRQ